MGLPAWYLDDPADIATLPRQPRWESNRYTKRLERIMHETQRGVRYAYELFERGEPTFIFRIPASMLPDYQAIHDATRGDVLPFYFVPDIALFVESPLTGVLYVRKEKDFAPEFVAPGVWTSSMEQIFDYALRLTEEVPAVEIED